MSKLMLGDCTVRMGDIDSDSVDLIYLDPPYNTGKVWEGEAGSFVDIYDGLAEYINVMYEALSLCRRVLKPTGCIYLHSIVTVSHHLRIVMDDIFGINNFRNEIIWKRHQSTHGSFQHAPKQWGSITDPILFYSKSNSFTINPYEELTESDRAKKFNLVDEDGRRYYKATLFNSISMGARPNLCYTWKGFTNPHPSGWRLSKPRLKEEYKKGNIVIINGKIQRRTYEEDFRGTPRGNLWTDIKPVMGKESVKYPTQKPLALLERIIKASSKKGETILDPFCGSGTTCVAAKKLGRRFIGIDESKDAIRATKARLEPYMKKGLF